jgi:[ribosomal protein S5]-alanine N-acetyltransferase
MGELSIPPIRSERVDLVSLSLACLKAILAGRRAEAASLAGIAIPAGWPDDHDARFLRLRAEQMQRDPARADWPVYAVALREPGRPMVGHAGFHGPPGINGLRHPDAVEVGYTIFEPYRGNGYATEAARALIGWARDERGISHFIASVAPDNVPSLALVRRLGFVQTGSQWDEEDGEELVFELRLKGGTRARSQDAASN